MKDKLSEDLQFQSLMGTVDFTEELNFSKYWLVCQRRWWLILIVALGGMTLAGLYLLQKPKAYQADGKLLVKPDQSSQLTGFDVKSGEIKALTQKTDPLSTEAEILKSQPVLSTAAKTLNLKDRKGKPIDAKALAKQLTVKPVTGTDILQVTHQSDDPEVAARVVNQVMKDYISNNVQVNRSQAVAARQFILTELPPAEAKVRLAEDALRRFREANGVIALEQEAQESVKNLGLLNQNIASSAALLSQSEARVSQLRTQVGMDVQTALVVNSLNQSESLQKALKEWRAAQAELAKQRTFYQDDTPDIKLLADQVRAAQAVLDQQTQEIAGRNFDALPVSQLQLSKTNQDLAADLAKAEVERLSLREGLASLSRSRSEAAEKSRSMPRLEANQRELQRQVDAAQTTYKTLLTKLQEVEVTENQTVGNARIVSNASVPDAAGGPGSGVMLVGGGIAGLLFGLSLAFLVDYLDRTVKTLQEVTTLMPYSVVGVIPQIVLPPYEASMEGMPQLITQDSPHFGGQEAYQMLQANLRFLPIDQVARSILVTSAGRQEGKSTVAANLALALAQGQRRVLLVDADMRYGCQHHVWKMSNAVGLSNVLVGQVPMEQAIGAVRENLHVLTGGTVPPNPLVLLDSAAMAMLVGRFTEHYDFVVFDGPTLLGTADSTVLNRLVDGSLIVARLGMVAIEQLKAMRKSLQQSEQQVLGMVVNGANGRTDRGGKFSKGHQGQLMRKPKSKTTSI
jgi:polysaccharide biosynthesis transport protein